MRRGITGTGLIAVIVLLSSCTRLSPSVPTGRPAAVAALPTSSAGTSAPIAVPDVSGAARATSVQLGVQVYWHDVTDPAAVKTNADRLLDYVVGLGANSVGISFPIYTDGARPTRVYAKDVATPSPQSIRTVAAEAKARGLRVMLRPLIDEQNITNSAGAWRGSITPGSIPDWFTSYRQTLLPFLAAAQTAHADTFVLGSELDSLVDQAAQWHALEAASAAVFSGRLAYADNWGQWATGRPAVAGTDAGLDAYPQLDLPDSASVPQIAAAWTAWLHKRPAGLADTVVQEVGIAATPGAYGHPAAWGNQHQPLSPQIQVNWFAGACDAVRSLHLSGIYYWDLDAWDNPAQGASTGTASFIGRGDAAIKACFTTGWPGQ